VTWDLAVQIGRIVNAALATADLMILFAAVRGWKTRSAGNRFLWSGVALMLTATVYGSVEQLLQGSSAGWRTAVTSIALIYILCGLVSKLRGRWTEDVHPDNGRRRGLKEVHFGSSDDKIRSAPAGHDHLHGPPTEGEPRS
jgi:hypothetical protein